MSLTGILIGLGLLALAWVFVRTACQPAALTPEIPPDPVLSGFAIALCYRERKGSGSPQTSWAKARAQLVSDNRTLIGYQSYAQVHRVSRWHIVSILLQLSRSWPVVALVSFLRGLPITSPRFMFRQRTLEAWDLVEIFQFDSSASALRFLADTGLADLRHTLNADATQWTRYRQAVPMQLTAALDRQLSREHAVFNLFFLRAREHLGRQAMLDYWLRQHRPFALQQQPVLEYNLYHQYIAQQTDTLETAAGSMSSDGACAKDTAWDGIAAVGFAGMSPLLRGIPNPRVQVANFRLVFDEVRFIDIKRSSLVLGRVRHYDE